MKEHIDFFETFRGELIGKLGFRSKFIRYWGTQTIDGVEVLNKNFMVYPGFDTNINIKRMLKILNMTSDIESADFSPIAGFYLWLNPDKGAADLLELNREILAERVDTLCPQDEWKYGTINYIEKQDPSIFNGYTKEQLLAYIDNDYRRIFDRDNGFVVGDTLIENLMGKYVLFDDGTEFDVEVLSSSVTAVPTNISVYITDPEGGGTYKSKQVRYTGLSISIRYKRKVFDIDPNGLLITTMFEEAEEAKVKELKELMAGYNEYDETGGYVEQEPLTNEVWYKGQLRVSALRAKGISVTSTLELVLGALDTGQIKKKVPWYKKVLGFVLIVIALVITYYTGNVGFTASAIAYAMGAAILIMVLIQAQWGKNNAAAAEYMGRWVKVAQVISIVASVYEGVWQAIAKLAVAKAVTEATGSEALGALASLAVGSVTTSGASLGKIVDDMVVYVQKEYVSIAMKVLQATMELKQKDMNNDLQDLSRYNQQLQEQIAEEGERNGLLTDISLRVSLNPLATSMTRYDYDFPYGAEYSEIHIGNIQRSQYAKAGGLNIIT